ncbi:MAG TPA: hypothetical protein VFQ20_12455 [Burkholderiaceae bacterium]|nr:hypothetical protein [Burkholderiaceae bacterium]
MKIRRTLAAFSLAAFASGLAHGASHESKAKEAKDDDALSLADQTPQAEKRAPTAWRAFGELAASRNSLRGAADAQGEARLSLDLRYDGTLAPGWRFVFSDRLDLARRDEAPRENNVNTLREGYLSWQASPEFAVDVGRVNLRYGAAFGYNPTDFFKEGALRSIVSLDPPSLRENRQGTFVVQAQRLWAGSALSLAVSPDLGRDAPSDATWSLDTGATNPRNRWLLAASHKFGDAFNPQLLVYGGERTPTQVGLNLSALVGSSTVAFAEVASGRGLPLAAHALGAPGSEHSQRRASLGFTHTTPFNLALTVEAEYDGAAPTRTEWNALTAGQPLNALLLLAEAERRQDLPTRNALFMHARWQDAFTPGLDLSAFVRRDGETRSQTRWVEARYRWQRRFEFAAQWLHFAGTAGSAYGSMPITHSVQLSARAYF